MATLAETFVGQALQENAQRDPNPGSGFQVGAQIAMHAQDVQMQQQHLQAQQKQLKEAQLEKFAQAVEKGQQYTGKAQSNYYNKFLPQYRNALNLQNDISDDSLAFNGASEEMIRRQGSLISKVNRRELTMQQALDIYHDPQKMVDMFGGPTDVADSAPLDPKFAEELNKSEKSAELNKATMTKQQNTFAQEDKRDFNTFKGDIAKQARSDFKPLVEDQKHLRQALGAADHIQAALDAGKKPSRQDMTALSLGMLTAVTKRVNETELNQYAQQNGLAGYGEDAFVKWFSGGVNPETFRNLRKLAVGAAGNLDQEIQTTARSFEDQVNNSAYSAKKDQVLAPVKPYVQKTYQPPSKKTFNIGGIQMNEQQARDFGAAHPEFADQLKAMGVK